MKRFCVVFLCFVCLLGSGCQPDASSEFSLEMTETVKGAFGEQFVKKPLRMLNIEGELYFDTGMVSDTPARCGTLDKILKHIGVIGEVPIESNTANFACEGCQLITKITCEVPIDGEWVIFKKFKNQIGETENLSLVPYCFYIKGRLNNAVIDSELAVLTDDSGITFSDIFEPLLSSKYSPAAAKKAVLFNFVQSGDPWGIVCTCRELTNCSMTLEIEQFGGNPMGQLQTGEWFSLSVQKEGEWIPVATNPLIDYAFPMTAKLIEKNDVTEFVIEWKWLYGELPPGYYRLDKKVMDFRGTGDFDEKMYSVEFTIE